MPDAQSTRWCFTINNPTAEDTTLLDNVFAGVPGNGVVYIVYGREVGENGTPHLQGFVSFASRKRLGTVRRIIGLRGHYEPTRGTTAQAADYCKKDGDFVEAGTAPVTRVKQPTITDFRDWVLERHERDFEHPSTQLIAQTFPGLYVRYGPRLSELASYISPHPQLTDQPLNDWQTRLHNTLQREADDRTIMFYVDEDGGKGKSFFCRYYLTNYNVNTQVLSVGRRDDIAHAVDTSKRFFLFNMPRGGMEFLQYSVLEQLKDRMVFSPKYNSVSKVLWFKPHVVVFCNEYPDMTKMSADRYIVERL
jgi:Putative viral replication protein